MTRKKNPKAPGHLSNEAKDLWDEYVGNKIRSPGAITLFHEGLEALDRSKEAGRLLREKGFIVTTAKTGAQHVNPAYNILKESQNQVTKIWKMLGLHFNGKY